MVLGDDPWFTLVGNFVLAFSRSASIGVGTIPTPYAFVVSKKRDSALLVVSDSCWGMGG
jgi:hypothetical protein